MKIIYKKTHVIIDDNSDFTSIKKRNEEGEYTVFTTKKMTAIVADEIEGHEEELKVLHIDYDNGFVKIKSSKGNMLNSIVDIICQTLHKTNDHESN